MKYLGKLKLQPESFMLESKTMWSFPTRGSWATHKGFYSGNWSPYIPRNIIIRYSKEGDIILDQFLGSGTTLIECKLLNRNGVGIDINPKSIKIAKDKLNFDFKSSCSHDILEGDAKNLSLIQSNSIDLICTHPPYANIIKYSENIREDLSQYDIVEFLVHMGRVANESYRVLKQNKFCAIMIGDIRKNKNIQPLGFNVMQTFINVGFTLKEIIIKEQHNCTSNKYWSKRRNLDFLLISHEYLFIFYKS
ncbi:DNA methyltransferase [Herbivorax sp. ANBcel31]|uniref:TRM11 family SAM-dependent methyltransferase n=1 Tax=Herbivorax sp. ANBcel31 TaxID=3069754 RepID=UPI0027B56E0F|nr:DNA methyltransferase [Herbivorax sp. ANBcel31]MDQ2088140.1 DNA methyltransferase [Herbivorax sp. ANBcel31]